MVILVGSSAHILSRLQPELSPDSVYLVIMTLTTGSPVPIRPVLPPLVFAFLSHQDLAHTPSATSVGFGDVACVTPEAKAFLVVLTLVGLGLFSTFADLLGEWRSHLTGIGKSNGGVVEAFESVAFAGTEGLSWQDALYLAVMTGAPPEKSYVLLQSV